MTNDDRQKLCLDLMHADSERDVIDLLRTSGYWDQEAAWRRLGDQKYNYSTVGNQQSLAEQAIVEKLINSIDAKLMAEARIHGYLPKRESRPQQPDTPTSLQDARLRFFGAQLNDYERLSRSITVSATAPGTPRQGYRRPCFTIVDDGEGQTPSRMPETILSLLQGNKDQIAFAQGKFNMGGTGVLEFCSQEHNLQLVLSKRHPALVDTQLIGPLDDHWSFTIIRRIDPREGKSSSYVYLAPVDCEDNANHGELLTFSSANLPIFPELSKPYSRPSAWGTLIKLYEYDATGFRTNLLQSDGLMARVRILIPEPALPIRFHECRPFRGHTGSYDTTMNGLIHTLERDIESDRRDNVEWYDEIEFYVDGQAFRGKIFLFRDKSTADRYRKTEGIIFSYNGQCHGVLPKDFFRRRRVNKDYLWHSLLLVVDCSGVSPRSHERLFMNGRDRLRQGEFQARIEAELENQIREHEELKEIQAKRRQREISANRESSESLAKALEKILAANKTLAALLGEGVRVKNPHKPEKVESAVAGFIGKRFPTKFHLRGKNPEEAYRRDAHLGSKVRLIFETDAANGYFRRTDEPGEFGLFLMEDSRRRLAENYSRPRLLDGRARMALEIPEGANVGDELEYLVEVNDPSRVEPLRHTLLLNVCAEQRNTSGTRGRENGGGDEEGTMKGAGRGKGGQDGDSRVGIPEPQLVREDEWEKHDPAFDKFTAVRIRRQPETEGDAERYDYYVNLGNAHLRRYVKDKPREAERMERQFAIGMTLVGLSMVHHAQVVRGREGLEGNGSKDVDVHDRVEQTTSALAPFLLPIVESLGEIGDIGGGEGEGASEEAA